MVCELLLALKKEKKKNITTTALMVPKFNNGMIDQITEPKGKFWIIDV